MLYKVTNIERSIVVHLCIVHIFVSLLGHKQVAELLLKAKASTTVKMGDLTPVDIARDFDHHEIYRLLLDIQLKK